MNKSNIWAGTLTLLFVLLLTACGGGGGGSAAVITYTIGGSVSGLAGSGLVLQNNSGDDLTISADGSFTFATAIADGSAYSVTVLTQPGSPNQNCAVTNAGGTLAGANVTDVAIACTTNTYTIGGTVSGLAGGFLVLQNNSGDDLFVDVNDNFTFATALADGSAYSVTVLSQPAFSGQTCTVTNAGGTLAGAGITDITVFCPQAAVTPTVSSTEPKVLTFSWSDVGADHYKLLKNPDGTSGYTQVGADTALTSMDETIPVHIQDWVNASYIVQSCDVADNCTDSAAITTTSAMLDAIGYFKASNTDGNDRFGYTVSLSADGHTLAVAAHFEDSGASGNGLPGDTAGTDAINSGAVYVFTNAGGSWLQQAFLKADNAGADDRFGYSLSLSGDGNTLAVGAFNEDGADDGTTDNAGAAYVFARSGSTWNQQGYLTAGGMAEAADQFGYAVSLSTDGNTLAVGAWYEDRNGQGFDNGLTDDAGAVYMFTRVVTTWSQQAYLKASNVEAADWFGSALSLSGDGLTLAVGAYGEDSNAVGYNGDETNNLQTESGAVYLFHFDGTNWSQKTYVKASNTQAYDFFGYAVSMGESRAKLAVGAYGEDGSATGVGGDETTNSKINSGAVYQFYINPSFLVSQWGYIKASNSEAGDWFGRAVSLSGNGLVLAVGAYKEASNATGINGSEADNSQAESGAVYSYRFNLSSGVWEQFAYVKASNTEVDDQFGYDTAVSLSADGDTLAVGAHQEDSAATGIGGDQGFGALGAGAVYLY